MHLVVGKERSTLLVGRLAAPDEWNIPAHHGRNSNDDRQHEEDSHDGEGEDPLERDDLAVELCDSEGGG